MFRLRVLAVCLAIVLAISGQASAQLIGRYPYRGFRGSTLVVRDRACKLAATIEMVRQFRCDDVQPADPGCFEPARNARMVQDAT